MIDSDTDWYIRHRICEALEGVAREVRAMAREVVHPATVIMVANAIEAHASKMAGQLQHEADREAEDQERSRESWHRSASA